MPANLHRKYFRLPENRGLRFSRLVNWIPDSCTLQTYSDTALFFRGHRGVFLAPRGKQAHQLPELGTRGVLLNPARILMGNLPTVAGLPPTNRTESSRSLLSYLAISNA